MWSKNNDSVLRNFFSPSFSQSFPAHSAFVSLHSFLLVSLSRLSSIRSLKCHFLRNRSIGLFVRFYWPESVLPRRLFSAASISFSSVTTQFPLSRPLWSSAGIDPLPRTWLAVANLITGSPHWLVAALCIFFPLLHAQVYILALGKFLFFLFSSFPRTNPFRRASSVFAGLLRGFGFSAKLCGQHDCTYISGRMLLPPTWIFAV